MSVARIEVARASDDAALRALLRDSSVAATVTLSFRREPSFWGADALLGDDVTTLVARDGGDVVAMASVAVRSASLGGRPARVAYVGGVRIAPPHQGRGLLGRGVVALRDLLEASGVDAAVAAVSSGNRAAERALFDRRRAPFAPFASLRTLTFAASAWAPRRRPGGPVRVGAAIDAGEVVELLGRLGPRRDLFPAVSPAALAGALPGLDLGDVLVARRGGAACGAVAVWDPGRVRQTHVLAYGPRLRRLKPWLDLTRRARGARPLPRAGHPLELHYATWLCAEGDDPGVAAALLAAARRRAGARGAHALVVTLDERDPLLRALSRPGHVAYASRLATFAPLGGAQPERVVHVDAAQL